MATHADLIKQTAYTLLIFTVAALPGYFLAAWIIDRLGRRLVQAGGFCFMALAFACLWLIPGATSTISLFLILFGATDFFAEFWPNTAAFDYPAEIFPVRVRTTSHGIAVAAGKIGAFIGTYTLTSLLPTIGLGRTSGLVAALVTIVLLPEPKGRNLENSTSRPRTEPHALHRLVRRPPMRGPSPQSHCSHNSRLGGPWPEHPPLPGPEPRFDLRDPRDCSTSTTRISRLPAMSGVKTAVLEPPPPDRAHRVDLVKRRNISSLPDFARRPAGSRRR